MFGLLRRLRHDFKNLAVREAKLKGISGIFPKDKEAQLEELSRAITSMSIRNQSKGLEAFRETFADAQMREWWS